MSIEYNVPSIRQRGKGCWYAAFQMLVRRYRSTPEYQRQVAKAQSKLGPFYQSQKYSGALPIPGGLIDTPEHNAVAGEPLSRRDVLDVVDTYHLGHSVIPHKPEAFEDALRRHGPLVHVAGEGCTQSLRAEGLCGGAMLHCVVIYGIAIKPSEEAKVGYNDPMFREPRNMFWDAFFRQYAPYAKQGKNIEVFHI